MKKFLLQAVLLIIVIGVALFFFKQSPELSNIPFVPQTTKSVQVEINNNILKAEVADTQAKRSKGLSGRQSLASDEGMLFVFDNSGKHPFWMKGLSFPLDFIWINNNQVVDLTADVPPPVLGQSDVSLPIFQSKEDANKVLEVNAGTIQKLNIKVGDSVQIQ